MRPQPATVRWNKQKHSMVTHERMDDIMAAIDAMRIHLAETKTTET